MFSVKNKSGSRRATSRFNRTAKAAIGALLVATVGLTGCSSTTVQAQSLGLRYAVGPFDGDEFKEVVEPGDVTWVANDVVWPLPIDQRTYNACEGGDEQGCDAPAISVATKDQLVVDFELASSFKLNTRTDDIKGFDGGTARRFLEQVCRKTRCVKPENSADLSGWNRLLKERYRPALEAAFKDVVRGFSGDDLVYNNPVALNEGDEPRPALEIVAEQVGPRFLKYLKDLVGGDYFCGPSFDRLRPKSGCPPIELLVRKAEFHNPDVLAAREAVKIAKDKALAAKTEAEGTIDARKAFGSPQQYIDYLTAQALLECAKKGGNCVIVVSNGTPISVNPK